MSLDLLDAPLRLSWDISAADNCLTAESLLAVGQQLLDAGVFYVSLELDPLAHPSIIQLLEQLTSGGCQVSLIIKGTAEELTLLDSLPRSVKLYLDCSAAVTAKNFDPTQLAVIVKTIRASQREPFLLWLPRSCELPLLLEMIDFCVAESIRGFKLPNQKISASSGPDQSVLLPVCNDLEQLSEKIQQSGLPDAPQLQLEVHDLFLWELLQPLSGGARTEYGGCQAGNSLGHIDVTGLLYPCSSWPEVLGNLLQEDLLDLWQSQQRLRIRQQIGEIPVGCEGCGDYQICFGGCRGLSGFCRDDGLKRDLLCAGKRSF